MNCNHFYYYFNRYHNTKPHEGFDILKKWCKNKKYFIITSNVDGHFQLANFPEDHIYEVFFLLYY